MVPTILVVSNNKLIKALAKQSSRLTSSVRIIQ